MSTQPAHSRGSISSDLSQQGRRVSLSRRVTGVLAALSLCAVAGQASAANLLINPGFEIAQNGVPVGSGFIDHGSNGQPWFAGWGTAADSWPATSNDLNYGTVTTWLDTNIIHSGQGSTRSILVSASTTSGGIAQQYLATGAPAPAHQRFSAWVFVVAGQMQLGLGSGAAGFSSRLSNPSMNLQWQYLEVCGTRVNNEVLLYTANNAPSVFYVDDAKVDQLPLVTGAYCP